MERFDQTYSYKLIYVFSMPYETHKGLLKVGEATLKTDIKPDSLVPNCHELNQAAKGRIDSYTKTASISYRLEYTELAIKQDAGYTFAFTDKDVHKVLMNSGIRKVRPNGSTGEEWFSTDIATVKAAIKAVKAGDSSITSGMMLREKPAFKEIQTPIDFREEQKDAVEKTISVFKKDNEMLWYAKMRFGKTLTALEVIRRCQYRKVIIVTHRPVVDDGWREDFKKIFFSGNSKHDYYYERKTKDSAYTFDVKTDSENDLKIQKLNREGKYFVYFASIQDLRGSKIVGGNFNKNNAVFALDWDLIIIDEAHEGTQTELGDNVIKVLRKENTKVLALSGTPFNLLSQYNDENVYTWDYVMEQKKKSEWDLLHPGDHNPYADLPKMHIYTYDLGEKLKKYITDEYETKAFNFREFFRVWYKGPNSKRELPEHAVEGNFVHEKDVVSFLDMLVKEDTESGYPYSTQEYRDMFRHTLWMVPGVKEAKALSELLRKHPIFGAKDDTGNCLFGIANVAGQGDRFEEEHTSDALDLVRNTIKNYKYSITLSCGKLTTGVTVKEWTAVLMLSGSYSTAAAQYMQTIFRVQSAGSIDGRQKTDCYVFDFAPDRTLKVLAETVHLSRKPGKSEKKRREAMTEFLNYCPVIAVSGSRTRKYSVESMMEQIKQIYAERAVNSGFEDESIYNDELLKLDDIDASKFNELKDIIGSSKAQKKKAEVVVNGQGLTDEQLEHIDDPDEPDGPDKLDPPTPEQIAERLARKQAKEARKKAIDILRGISIRMPLMIYGADVPIDEDIDIDRFVDIVDPESWKEFMPQGVTKEIFSGFTKYYDRDVFIAAGKRIRRLAAAADKETPTRRVIQIAEIFRHFKNPDKETVLTPWRVVNMHMSDTIGGWCFFNEKFEDDTQEEKHRLEEPRFVDRGDVTSNIFHENGHVLEINSKTGLYPLYIAYSFYRQKLNDMTDDDYSPEECQYFWNDTIKNNVFVICKTPMAKSITRRTLCGYSDIDYNAHYFDDLANMLKNKPEQFKKRVLKGSYWKKDVREMKFDAIVGNPPYQVSDGGYGVSSAPIYPFFVDGAKLLEPNYFSMIMPAKWYSGGKNLDNFREAMINDKHIRCLYDFNNYKDIFPTADVAGGLCYFLWDANYTGDCCVVNCENGNVNEAMRRLNEFSTFIRSNIDIGIVRKVSSLNYKNRLNFRVSSSKPFGIRTFYKPQKEGIPCYFIQKIGLKYALSGDITDSFDLLNKWKFLIPAAPIAGQTDFSKPIGFYYDGNTRIAKPGECCTESWLVAGAFETENEVEFFKSYILTKTVRFLLLQTVVSQHVTKENFAFIPDLEKYDRVYTDKYLCELWGITDNEWKRIDSRIRNYDASTYSKLLKIPYVDCVKYFIKKYGEAKHNYFKDTNCTIKNSLVSRTEEGLYCHHIDEDKAIMLSNDKFAASNSFDYQKADRLVYCNLLEHLILHTKIAEKSSAGANVGELPGIGGAINFICKDLNGIYAGRKYAEEWRQKIAELVKDDFDDYILVLKYLWKVIEENPVYSGIISKDDLCMDWDGNVVPEVKAALETIDCGE